MRPPYEAKVSPHFHRHTCGLSPIQVEKSNNGYLTLQYFEVTMVFCSVFFYDTSEEKFLTSDFSFSQVTEVDKREPRESFLKPRPQAEAEKCSPRFCLSTEVT